jgi:hypothetical protein
MLRWALARLKRRFISGRFSTNGRTALERPVDWALIRDLHQPFALLFREVAIQLNLTDEDVLRHPPRLPLVPHSHRDAVELYTFPTRVEAERHGPAGTKSGAQQVIWRRAGTKSLGRTSRRCTGAAALLPLVQRRVLPVAALGAPPSVRVPGSRGFASVSLLWGSSRRVPSALLFRALLTPPALRPAFCVM